MRPKKHILLYCADAPAGEQLGWLLEVRCLHPRVQVTTVSSLEGFVSAASATVAGFDCVIIYRSKLGEKPLVDARTCADRQICELLSSVKSGGVVLELMDGLPLRDYRCAGRLVPAKVQVAMADVVAAVGIACARKRGPLAANDVRRGFAIGRAEIGMVA